MSTISIQSPAIRRVATGASAGGSDRTMHPRTRLRLTARGRRVLAGLAAAPVVATLAVSVLAGGSALASGEEAAAVSFRMVSVMPGDTLWSIAVEVAPHADPRDVIDDIIRLNHLDGATIQAGTDIAIPVQYSR